MISLTPEKLKEMFLSGAAAVSNEFEYINELNVFPVPDGDTGTNMKITIDGACDAIRDVDYSDLFALGRQFSRELLMNARGNSGVIFSQIMKGFSSVFKEGKTELGISDFIDAFVAAKNAAYVAVTTPVEGTILTVIRVTSENLKKAHNSFKTIENVMEVACREARIILERTPEFLQELKEVGVVDSGGYGLCCFFDGMFAALKADDKTNGKNTLKPKVIVKKSFVGLSDDKNDGFGYCCEFVMTLRSKVHVRQKDKSTFSLEDFKKQLDSIGDSIAIVNDENIVKVHIHSLTPYKVLEIGSQYGEFNKVKIENMTLQFLERNPGTTLGSLSTASESKDKLSSEVRIVATVPSSTVADLYLKEFAIAQTIVTETTGNPSIHEFLVKIKETKSSNVIIVVDDGNVVLAAKEAIDLIPKGVNVKLINAHNIAASYLACLAYNPVSDIKDNFDCMEDTIDNVRVAKLSKSSKVVNYSHIDIRKDDYIGIFEKKVIVATQNPIETAKKMSDYLVRGIRKSKFAYILYGRDTSIHDVKALKKYLTEVHSLKVETINGNQQVYNYYIAVRR